MSSLKLVGGASGLCFNSSHAGLLGLTAPKLDSLVQKVPIGDRYTVEQVPFARGKFATVRKCTHLQTKIEYAAKFIRKRRRAMDQRHEIIHEMAVLSLANVAGVGRIVRLHEVYETAAEMILVLEMAAGGELQRVIDEEEALDERDAKRVMRQILEGLIFLHDRNIAHLDIKPQNLLLMGRFPHCDIKLCDFGISRVIQKKIEVREIMGTPDYVAPEILSFEPISLATDIWSVGVLVYVLLTGHSPFSGDTKQETFCNISQCSLEFPDDLFQDISELAKNFIRAALVVEPSGRPSARECLVHPWLTGDSEGQTLPLNQSPRVSSYILQRPLCDHSRDQCDHSCDDKENMNSEHLDVEKLSKKMQLKTAVQLRIDRGVLY